LSAGATYSYRVSAYDAANNESAQSGAVSVTTPGGGSGGEIIIDDTAAQRAGSWGGPSQAMPNYYQTGYYWNGTKSGPPDHGLAARDHVRGILRDLLLAARRQQHPSRNRTEFSEFLLF
jgi:hypothetical protein